MRSLSLVTLVVRDYDEAIAYFVGILGFQLVEDVRLDARKRWVVVAPGGGTGANVLLAKAAGQGQAARIGDQTGGRVAFFLTTDHLDRDYERLSAAGVLFTEAPRDEEYGRVVVFEDLYGNRWDLIQPCGPAGS